MALLFFDGFDFHNSDTERGWALPGEINSGAGRGVGKGWQEAFGGSGGEGGRVVSEPSSTIIIGMAYRTPAYDKRWWSLVGEGTTHIYFGIDSNGNPYAATPGSTVAYDPSIFFGTNTWRYVEFKAFIDATAGSVEMRWDGNTVLFEDNIDTRWGTASPIIDAISFNHGFSDVSQAFMDDFYLCNGEGATHNNFLGDVKVETIYPTGNGNSSQLVGSDANSTDNYLLVDDTTAPSTADFVESSTPGDKDTYVMGNLLPTTGTVYAVTQHTYAAKTDAGTRSFKNVARLSATEQDGQEHFLGTGYAYYSDTLIEKPGGGDWTITDVNSAEFGVKIAS